MVITIGVVEMVAGELALVIDPVESRMVSGTWTGNFRERHAHHGCTSFVNRSEAFTTSDLLATVGVPLGGNAGEIRSAQCASR